MNQPESRIQRINPQTLTLHSQKWKRMHIHTPFLSFQSLFFTCVYIYIYNDSDSCVVGVRSENLDVPTILSSHLRQQIGHSYSLPYTLFLATYPPMHLSNIPHYFGSEFMRVKAQEISVLTTIVGFGTLNGSFFFCFF